MGSAAAVFVVAFAFLTDYTKRRIDIWRNPELYPQDGGWQTLQGLRAIGSGGFFGLGLGNSRQKFSYVSQPQNDFIYTIICEELGFFTRLYIRDDGSITMQICDENVISTSLTALIRSYMPGETEDGYGEEDLAPEPEHGKVSEAAVLYLFCRDTNTTDEFQAKKILDQEKLNYTLFLHSESQPGTLIRQNIVGMCGLTLPDLIKDGDITGALDDINSRFTGITRGWVYLTVSTGDDNWDESLRNAGYCPVKPDFVVNGGSDPDALINSILGTADERGWCSIWLENCWNTVEIARMIAGLDESEYRTANYAYRAPEKLPEANQ